MTVEKCTCDPYSLDNESGANESVLHQVTVC